MHELHIIETVVDEASSETGLVIAGENVDSMKQCRPTVRLYMIRLNGDQ